MSETNRDYELSHLRFTHERDLELMKWSCSTFTFDTRMPIVMGILNVTPDSFSDGGRYADQDAALAHARAMVKQGAQIIDVGGESTRPGSDEVACEEELERVLDVVKQLSEEGICVSIDTRHAEVARACVDAGASIINDVSGFRDPAMVEVATSSDVGLVVMHMLGEPKTMQDNPTYDDVVAEVKDYLKAQATMLEDAGVASDRICVDPGPGFGKTASQTHELMLNLQEIVALGYPVMVAISRKGYLGKRYNIDKAEDRDEVSAQEALQACELGASVVRTHNVELTIQELKNLRPYVYLGLGSNVALVGEPGEEQESKIAVLSQAIGNLCMIPDSQVIAISSFYESEPAYFEDQDPFVNAVVLMRTGVPPKELLNFLHTIENTFGRTRTVKNGPRTLDIDILDYQCYVIDNEILTLPHPLVTERDFVVKPLLEISPGHVLADDVLVVEEGAHIGKSHRINRTV